MDTFKIDIYLSNIFMSDPYSVIYSDVRAHEFWLGEGSRSVFIWGHIDYIELPLDGGGIDEWNESFKTMMKMRYYGYRPIFDEY